jgi:competence protein ComEC
MKKILISFLFLLSCLFVLFLYQVFIFQDHKLHVIFCNVGQGDSILVRSPEGKVLLFDGGPDDLALSCLASHLPFWQRNIDLLFLSHPHADHFVGMFGLLTRYQVQQFVTERLKNDNNVYRAFMQRIKEAAVATKYVYAGDAYRLSDGVVVSIVGPSQEYLLQTSPNGEIGEKAEFASLITHISYGNFSVLLTGDSQVTGLAAMREVGKVNILQVPHHGSKTGLSEAILQEILPDMAVISVGKNRYGHPNKQILDLLKAKDIDVRRTDRDGDVEIVSDGKQFFVK